MKEPKRRLSLSSEDSELEEPEYRKEVEDDLIVLDDHSQLLDDYHLKMVSDTHGTLLNYHDRRLLFCLGSKTNDSLPTACCSYACKDSGLSLATGLQHSRAREQPENTVQEYGWPGQPSAAGHQGHAQKGTSHPLTLCSPTLLCVIREITKVFVFF